MNIPGLEENAIMIDSVSKRYSMCGARIGCIVSKKRANGRCNEICTSKIKSANICSSASEAALDTPQSYFDEVISEYRERRDTYN
jgi:aspartate aminotransferase